MRKFLSFIVLLAISSTLSFGQNLDVKLSTAKSVKADEANKAQNLEQYLNKNVVSNTKATLLDQGFEGTTFPPTGWTTQNLTTDPALQWVVSTIEHSGSGAAKVSSQNPATIARDEWLISPSKDLSSINNPCLKVWINMSYYWSISPNDNYDVRINVSPDGGTNWKTIWSEDSVGAEFDTWSYYLRWFNLADYDTSTNFKVAFQYVGRVAPTELQAAIYLDDITIEEIPANNITVDRVTLNNAYTQIPEGLGIPIYYDADITNYGVNTQTNIKLHGVDLTTGADSTSIGTTLLTEEKIIRDGSTWMWNTDYFFDPAPLVPDTYKVTSYFSSDSIPYLAQDTFDIKVVCDTCIYSRDNNTYTGYDYPFGTIDGLCEPYTAANDYLVSQDRMAYGVQFVVGGNSTRVGAKIRAVLYQWHSGSGYGTPIAQSANYYIKATDIPQHVWHTDPVSITLPFAVNGVPTGYTMQADSMYLVGVQVYGGIDTVTIAVDHTGIPQWEQESSFFSVPDWYKWDNGNLDRALMIRTVFGRIPTGISEITNNSVNLFSCMPNPANNTTKISYELKNSEKVSILITDITGRTIQTINQGTQTKGNYSVDIDLSNLTSGTYFYTLKTPTAQATDKLIVVKR